MDLVTQALPIALGTVMLGLGLGLTLDDFRLVASHPRAVVAALFTQLLILPLVAVGLIYAFGLPPVLAVGMMLLAAAPGGPIANVYSHLFGGDVALNIALTAINSVLAIVTIPVIYNLATAQFAAGDDALGLQFGKAVEVSAIVLVPIAVGMFVRRRREDVARRLDGPVRIFSVVLLSLLIVGSIAQNFELLRQNAGALAGIAATFGAVNLTMGYALPRLLGVSHRQAIACGFEIGMHNAVMAIVIARTVIGSEQMALPPAIYTMIQLPMALLFGVLLRAATRRREGGDRRSVEVPQSVAS